MKFPAECTKFLQPMDLSVNRSLKNFYSHKWEKYISSLSQKNLTKSGYFQAPTREDKVAWISWAWENVTETTVSNGFNVYKKHIQYPLEIYPFLGFLSPLSKYSIWEFFFELVENFERLWKKTNLKTDMTSCEFKIQLKFNF